MTTDCKLVEEAIASMENPPIGSRERGLFYYAFQSGWAQRERDTHPDISPGTAFSVARELARSNLLFDPKTFEENHFFQVGFAFGWNAHKKSLHDETLAELERKLEDAQAALEQEREERRIIQTQLEAIVRLALDTELSERIRLAMMISSIFLSKATLDAFGEPEVDTCCA
jgi:hypothetical protein